jgi:hypothetical protein
MINQTKLEIDKIYKKIDKIAKKGNDNFLEYSILFDYLIKDGKYSYLKECIEYKYEYDISFMDIPSAKKESWKEVLFRTNSSFQDFKRNLLKSRVIYQSGLYYYKDIPTTSAKVIDISGTGAELNPIVQSGSVTSISIVRVGSGYSASASIVITGGYSTASAVPIIRGGKVYSTQILDNGTGHNMSLKLGKIEESDEYLVDVSNKFTKDLYQRIIGNKTTILTVTKEGYTYSETFSSWNTEYSYDKNISNLYTQAVNYLVS